jgi:hypothetical protein
MRWIDPARWVALTLLAVPAFADMPPLCQIEAGNADFPGIDSYTPYSMGDGFISLTLSSAGDQTVDVVQHCASGLQMIIPVSDWTADAAMLDQAFGRFAAMITSDITYTMTEFRAALAEVAPGVQVSRFTYESCGCATYGFPQN